MNSPSSGWAGRLDKAEGAVAAAVRGAITLPPGHRVTGRVARTAARLALSQGDLPRARAALERDRRAQSARLELRPSLPPARELTFLEAATDADSRQAFVARRAARAAGRQRSAGASVGQSTMADRGSRPPATAVIAS